MNPFWFSEFCQLLICSFMYLLERKNAIKRFLAICLGSFGILTLLPMYIIQTMLIINIMHTTCVVTTMFKKPTMLRVYFYVWLLVSARV